MTYLDELLIGYRQGLADKPPSAIQDLRVALAKTDDPRRRGALLGLLATALSVGAEIRSSMNETPS